MPSLFGSNFMANFNERAWIDQRLMHKKKLFKVIKIGLNYAREFKPRKVLIINLTKMDISN